MVRVALVSFDEPSCLGRAVNLSCARKTRDDEQGSEPF